MHAAPVQQAHKHFSPPWLAPLSSPLLLRSLPLAGAPPSSPILACHYDAKPHHVPLPPRPRRRRRRLIPLLVLPTARRAAATTQRVLHKLRVGQGCAGREHQVGPG